MALDQSTITRAEWSALKAAGVTRYLADGKTSRLDRESSTKRLAEYLREHADVNTEQEFATEGISMAHFVQHVFELPNTASDDTKEGVQGYIKSRLAGTSEGDVQGLFTDGWLIKGRFTRQVEDPTSGTIEEITLDLWGVTSAVDLIVKYAVLPAHKRVLSAERGNLRDSIEQARRVPALAAELMAVQVQRAALVELGTSTARKELTAGMTTEQIKEFDHEVADKLSSLDALLADHRKAIESAA